MQWPECIDCGMDLDSHIIASIFPWISKDEIKRRQTYYVNRKIVEDEVN